MSLIDLLIVLLVLSWAGGLYINVGGMIHLLLIVVLALVIGRLVRGKPV